MYISVNSFIHQVSALCLEVQESESATVVTFSPYYPGCVPVQIINHFTDVTLQFKQNTKYVKLNACQNGCFMVHKTWLTGAKGESSWVGMGSAVH